MLYAITLRGFAPAGGLYDNDTQVQAIDSILGGRIAPSGSTTHDTLRKINTVH